MRVFLFTFIFAMLHMAAAQAAEPIVVLTFGENRADYGSMSDEYSSHPMRKNPDEFKKHEVLEAETLGHIMSEYYGGSGLNMAFVQMFRPQDRIRLTQSPSGGGTGNPAWDFQWFIPDYEVGKLYRMVMRAQYLPFESPEQIQRDSRSNRSALGQPITDQDR